MTPSGIPGKHGKSYKKIDSNSLYSYFANVGGVLASKISPVQSSHRNSLMNPLPVEFYPSIVTEHEINSIVRESKACSADKMTFRCH